MKKQTTLLLLLFIIFSLRPESETLNKAHLFHEQKEYQKAQELYEAVELKDGAIWSNLAQCYVAQDKPLEALVCWRKAQKTAYGSQFLALEKQIHQIEQQLGLTHQTSLFKRIYYFFKKYSLAVPVVIWQVIFLFLWYLILSLFFMRKRLVGVGSVLMVLCIGYTTGSLVLHYDAATARLAVIKTKEAPVYAGNDERFSQKMVITQGQPVTIKQTENAWYKIECNAIVGWVCADKLEEITT